MPSRSRRRETDGRAERFESQIRDSELPQVERLRDRGRLYTCSRCHNAFEERSLTCPRCEKGKTMGYLTRIPEKHLDEAQRGAIRRARGY